jgi:hypothetical protein
MAEEPPLSNPWPLDRLETRLENNCRPAGRPARKKAAERRFNEAIAAEWARDGVTKPTPLSKLSDEAQADIEKEVSRQRRQRENQQAAEQL